METDGTGLPADLPDRLRVALGGTYTVERELGGGGMSRVFLAHDARLGRRVVVKVLHPDLAAGLSARRFEREVTLAARLQHPHIVPLHTSGDVDGLPYYTMPYVQGESLRERLRREPSLPVPDAIRLIRELADALAYAHGEGLVHRDLKPENVLLSGGHAVVADFGIAKALATATHGGGAEAGRAAAPESTLGATGLGVAVGTPAYMAPEQAAADPATDHRADLYALGLIAYETLAGEHPFAGRSPQAMLAAQLTETPPALAARRAEVPFALDALVSRLLAKRPDERPQTALDVVRALDAIATPAGAEARSPVKAEAGRLRMLAAIVVGVALALIGAGLLVWRRNVAPATGRLMERRVAVVPFENQTGDSTLAPLGRLTSDWIAEGLVEASFAEVVDPQIVRAAWRDGADAATLGAATGARVVVSGAFSREGDSVRIVARITDAADGRLLQAVEPVNGPAVRPQLAVVALRERVLGAVAGLLDARTEPGMMERATNPPNLVAYRHLSTALEHWFRNEIRAALPELMAASRADSTFVGPLLYAGVAHSLLGEPAMADSFLRLAHRMRERLTRTDRHLLDAWRAEIRGDWTGALGAAQEATRLSPGLGIGLSTVWWNAIRANRPRDALAALRRADPTRPPTRRYPPYFEVLAAAHHLLGDYAAELVASARGRALHPGHVPLVFSGARARAALGQVGDAERGMGDALDLPADPVHTQGEMLWALGRELWAHHQEVAANAAFARALDWYESRPPAEQATAAHRGRRAEVLYAAGRLEDARREFERLATERTADLHSAGDHATFGIAPLGMVEYHGYLGALAARRGDSAAAHAADVALAEMPGTHLLGRHKYSRARIAALLGERDRAVTLLREALREGRTPLVVHAESDFAALRNMREFQELVRPKG